MDLTDMSREERCDLIQEHHAFLSNLVEPYSTLDDFTKDKDEWLAVLGIELTQQ